MIRGVSFNIPQKTSNILFQILKCIKTENFHWYNIMSQTEVWDSSHCFDFFEDDYYDGEKFLNLIFLEHFVLFLKLQAYSNPDDFSELHTYEEFINSNCQLLLLIYDCEFVEIFIKDSLLSKVIYKNALLNGFTKVKYITEENDSRVCMDVK